MSQGSMEGSINWTHYQGGAKGIDALYNLKIGYLLALTQACSGETTEKLAMTDMRDVADALDWLVADSPVEVLNFSYGEDASGDDDSNAQLFDYYADTYDLSAAIAGGNNGGSYFVSSPAIAYNTMAVANWDSGGLPNNSHEVINPTSSAGPTNGDRDKPDIAAPGTNIYSTAYDWDGTGGSNPDFVPHTGTSMAAPHIAGALALIRSTLPAGTEQGPVAKAMLLNSTDTPAGLGWQKGSGWGYVNLSTAWARRSYFDVAVLGVPSNNPTWKLYKVPLSAGPMRITATWNRHLTGATRDSFGNFSVAAWTLSAVNVALYDEDTGDQFTSTSEHYNYDNVAQFAAELSGTLPSCGIVNVNWSTGLQQPSTPEPVAMAFPTAYTVVQGPVLSVGCTIPAVVYTGANFPLTCTLSNSGDTQTFYTSAGITMPFGFLGSTGMQFGNILPGQTSAAVTNTMTALAQAGDYPFTVGAGASPYGAFFGATTNLTVHVVPNPNAAPWLAAVCPGWAAAGSGTLLLTLSGANFFPTSTVYWNGTALATTGGSTTELTASVPASLLAVPTTASVLVTNPSGTQSVGRNITVEPPAPPLPGIISTIAGAGYGCNDSATGSPNPLGDGGPATWASLIYPRGIAADGAGNVYIADEGDNRVRKVGPDGTISTFAGTGTAGFSGDSGAASSAQLNWPTAVATDGAGNVYIGDTGNGRVRKVDTHGIITTYAGSGEGSGPWGDGGPAVDATVGVNGLAVDGAGNLYIVDYGACNVRKVNPQGIISTLAGADNDDAGFSGDGGPATSALLDWPQAVAVDAAGNVFIADSFNNRVRKVDTNGIITTYAGNGKWSDQRPSGAATSASIGGATALAVDAAGNLYIAIGRIDKVTPDGTISTFAGTGVQGPSGEGGPATSASLNGLYGIALDGKGNMYVSEAGSQQIRKITGGGTATSQPYASGLSPAWAQAGGAGFFLNVSGVNFVNGSQITWDGTALTTTYVNPSVVIASISAEMIASAGTHSVVVANPGAGGGQTSPILFAVQPVVSSTPWISANPNPIPVQSGSSSGGTMISWSAPGHSSVAIYMYSPGGLLVATGGPSGSAPSPNYVGQGQQFFLMDSQTNETLASVTVSVLTDSRRIGVPQPPKRKTSPESQNGGAQGSSSGVPK